MHKISRASCRKDQHEMKTHNKFFCCPYNSRLRLLWNACGQILGHSRVEQPSTGWPRKFQTGRSQLFTTCRRISWLLPPSPSQLFTTCRQISWLLPPSPSQLFTTCRWISWLLPPFPKSAVHHVPLNQLIAAPLPQVSCSPRAVESADCYSLPKTAVHHVPPSNQLIAAPFPRQLFTTCRRRISWLLLPSQDSCSPPAAVKSADCCPPPPKSAVHHVPSNKLIAAHFPKSAVHHVPLTQLIAATFHKSAVHHVPLNQLIATPSPSQLFTTCRRNSWLLLPSPSQLLTVPRIISINVPVADMARVVIILMWANPFSGPLGRVGPQNLEFFGLWNSWLFLGPEMATTEASAIFDRCLDSNPESCRSKQARYQPVHPYPFLATHLPT